MTSLSPEYAYTHRNGDAEWRFSVVHKAGEALPHFTVNHDGETAQVHMASDGSLRSDNSALMRQMPATVDDAHSAFVIGALDGAIGTRNATQTNGQEQVWHKTGNGLALSAEGSTGWRVEGYYTDAAQFKVVVSAINGHTAEFAADGAGGVVSHASSEKLVLPDAIRDAAVAMAEGQRQGASLERAVTQHAQQENSAVAREMRRRQESSAQGVER